MGSDTLESIIQDALEELREWASKNPEDDATDREIPEIADSSVPIYNGDLLDLAASNNDLALSVPEIGPAFDGSPTPINIIAANVYEAIYNALHEEWSNILEERESE